MRSRTLNATMFLPISNRTSWGALPLTLAELFGCLEQRADDALPSTFECRERLGHDPSPDRAIMRNFAFVACDLNRDRWVRSA
jgi:hypothetical protein